MSQTTAPTAELLALSFTAAIGDEIEIHCANAKPRRLVVTAADARRLFVTSGPTVRRNLRGGLIDLTGYGRVMYQPTYTQQIRPVTDVRLVRRAAERN